MKTTDAVKLTAAVLTQQDARIQKLETSLPASVSAQVETARAALAAQIEASTATALAALGEQVQGERVRLSAERDRSLLELRALAEGEVIRRFAALEPAPAGPKGDGFRWRGSWDRETKYDANDVVFARGSSWIAVRPSQGVLPTDSSTDWDRMASAGSTGADGADGEVTAAQLAAAGRRGNTLYVDALYGVDATGTADRVDLPFLTIPAAITAASSGDLVHVRPGTYTAQVVLKNGVNLHFDAGAVVDYSSSAQGPAIWDNSAAVSCAITGAGAFIRSGTGLTGSAYSNATFELRGSGSITIEGEYIYNTCTNSPSHSPVVSENGTRIIRISGRISSSLYDAAIVNGGPTIIQCDHLAGNYSEADDGSAVEIIGGTCYVQARKISGTSGVIEHIGGTLYLDVAERFDWSTVSADFGSGAIIDLSKNPVVVSAGFKAYNGAFFVNVASGSYADPTPFEGCTYTVFNRNGTLTLGSDTYTAGALVIRTYHSGAWSNTPYATVASVTAINPAIAAGSNAVDFAANGRFTLTISGTVTFTGANYTAGVSELYYLTSSGGPHTLNFPSDWVFLTPKPTAIASGKRACLLLDSLTTAATGVRAFYTEES